MTSHAKEFAAHLKRLPVVWGPDPHSGHVGSPLFKTAVKLLREQQNPERSWQRVDRRARSDLSTEGGGVLRSRLGFAPNLFMETATADV